MPLTQLSTTLGVKRAAHLLRRTCAGASVSEIDAFALLTPQEAIEQLFATDLPDVPLPIDAATGEEWITQYVESEDSNVEASFLRWHLAQMLGSGVDSAVALPYIFRERLVLFMHTHFTTQRSKLRNFDVNGARALYYQQALFRMYAFDQEDITIPPVNPDAEPGDPDGLETTVPKNFKELTKKLCVDNAMLIFLDGRLNVRGSVNENFARELLELYSVGRGLEGNIPQPEFDGDYFVFTEQDVQEGAKVLSGFNIDTTFTTLDEDTGLPRGAVRGNVTNASQHEEGTKTLSSRLGGGTIVPNEELQNGGNPTEASVLDEISQLVDLVYDQAETARAICREIYRFFVYHEVSEALQNDIIQDMADVFTASEFKIQPVLEALFTSTHFYEAETGEDDNNFGAIIKSPIDLVLGFMRNFEVTAPDYVLDNANYNTYGGYLLGQIGDQGMDYYDPFEVAGYAAYHQFPTYNRNWISTNYLTNRYSFIASAVSDGMNLESWQVDIVQFVQTNFASEAPVARDLIIAIAEHFLPNSENLSFDVEDVGELTVERLNYFLNAFLFAPQIDDDPEGAWNNRWLNGLDPETVANQLTNLFNAMLQTPEYQLM